jgi:hypothetical protein
MAVYVSQIRLLAVRFVSLICGPIMRQRFAAELPENTFASEPLWLLRRSLGLCVFRHRIPPAPDPEAECDGCVCIVCCFRVAGNGNGEIGVGPTTFTSTLTEAARTVTPRYVMSDGVRLGRNFTKFQRGSEGAAAYNRSTLGNASRIPSAQMTNSRLPFSFGPNSNVRLGSILCISARGGQKPALDPSRNQKASSHCAKTTSRSSLLE